MTDCAHLGAPEKVVDRLGMMRERPDGSVNAPVLAWHELCPSCGAFLGSYTSRDPEQGLDPVELAIRKVAIATLITYRHLKGES